MAMKLREKIRQDYKSMNDGEKLAVEKEVRSRRVLPVLYLVEKIVAVKEYPKEVL